MRTTLPLAVAVLAATAVSAPALAGHDITRTMSFLGFNADASKFLIKVSDADAGDFLSLRNFTTGKQEKAIPIESKKDEKKLTEEAKKQFRIVDKGVDAPASPDGRFTLVGVPKGEKYLIEVTKGDKSAKFQVLPLESGRGGPARVSLKNVFWAKDGKKIVVILHRKLVDDNGIDADEVHPWEFFTGGLNFK